MKHMFIGLLFFSSAAFSNQNFTEEVGWIDVSHQYVSKKLHTYANHLDEMLSTYIDNSSENNVTSRSIHIDNAPPSDIRGWFSGYFRDEIFDEEHSRSYAYMRNTLGYNYQTGEYTPMVRIRTSLVLPKTENRLHLFIDNEDDEEDNLDTLNYQRQEKGSVGLGYSLAGMRYLDASLSIGTHALDNPYMKARFWKAYSIGKWQNRIVQSFEYSLEYKLEEETVFYFDRPADDDAMVRLKLGRQSHQEIEGMFYFGGIAYNKVTRYNKGYQIGAIVAGQTKPENKITKYSLYGVYKQNIYRKWLYYEVGPRVEWENIYDFKPNYILLLSFEIYFGKV